MGARLGNGCGKGVLSHGFISLFLFPSVVEWGKEGRIQWRWKLLNPLHTVISARALLIADSDCSCVMIAVFISLDATADESAPADDDDEKGFEIAIVHATMFFFFVCSFRRWCLRCCCWRKRGGGCEKTKGGNYLEGFVLLVTMMSVLRRKKRTSWWCRFQGTAMR